MISIYVAIALVTAGLSLLAGITNLSAGLYKGEKRAELIFGLQALSLFIFLVIPPVGFIVADKAPYPLIIDIKRIFIWAYYLLFTSFLSAYSGYRNKFLFSTIYAVSILSYVLMVFNRVDSPNPLWTHLADLGFALMLIYGLAAARHQIKTERNGGKWLLAAMISYGVLYIGSAILWFTLKKLLFPFHFNVIPFIIIMSIRMRVDSIERYRLEKALHWQDTRWNLLVQNMQILMVEMDCNAIIRFVNAYTVKKLGYERKEELIGKNWFETVAVQDEIALQQSIYRDSINETKLLTNTTASIRKKDDSSLVVGWTNVLMLDPDDSIRGMLSIGMDNTELVGAFEQVRQLKDELEKENLALKSETILASPDDEIVGNSEVILYAIQKAKQVATTQAGVLLLGETGSGKELFANLIHKNSYRSNKPLVKINCAALPAELIESELFGHEKGAFTGAFAARKGKFEMADGGTIFLDEIGELPLALQPKLLRVLQSGEFERIGGSQPIRVNVRIISATNRNLVKEVNAGIFREDLYYRLSVFPITVPSLRQRRDDIPMLASHFIGKFSRELSKSVTQISKADMARLCGHSWPGNVRELINTLERSVIQTEGPNLNLSWHEQPQQITDTNLSLLDDVERAHITKILKETNWKIGGDAGAAARLGLHPNTLRSRIKKLLIERDA